MRTEMTMAYDGEFLREYGKQYFVVASEALGIGRIKWNMVPIGKNGKEGIEYYMTTEQMVSLCSEILDNVHHTFDKKIKDDANNSYPGAYKYATGEDASLHLNIGGGKSGVRIQVQDGKSKKNYQMAVSMNSMKDMARKFFLNTGLTPVVPGSYYASVVAEFEKGRAERAKFRKKDDQKVEIADSVDVNSVVDEPEVVEEKPAIKEESKKVEPKKEEPKKEEPKKETKADVKKSEKSDDAVEQKNYTISVNGIKKINKDFYTFEGKDEDGKRVVLMFRMEEAEKLDWFSSFENAAATKETSITILGEKKGDYVLYVGKAKK